MRISDWSSDVCSSDLIVRIPVLSDNYDWLFHDPESFETMAVDPAVADPVLAEADARGWPITAIWNTHWHPDDTGGNADLKAKTGREHHTPAAQRDPLTTAARLVPGGQQGRRGAHAPDAWDARPPTATQTANT